ncbi:LOW QUALITY PROTEIN: hypothetical protein YC2023_091769 [Brassica napus]
MKILPKVLICNASMKKTKDVSEDNNEDEEHMQEDHHIYIYLSSRSTGPDRKREKHTLPAKTLYFKNSFLSLPSTVHLCNSGDRRVVAPLAPPPLGGGLWFEELVSGHGFHGGRVASWLGPPPVHGGPLSSVSRIPSCLFGLVNRMRHGLGGGSGGDCWCWSFRLVSVVSLATGLFWRAKCSGFSFYNRFLRRSGSVLQFFSCEEVAILQSVDAEFGMRGSACKNWRSLKVFSRSEFKIFILCLSLFSVLAPLGNGRGEVSAFALRLESGGVLGVHSSLCSSVVLLELLSFSSVGDVQKV